MPISFEYIVKRALPKFGTCGTGKGSVLAIPNAHIIVMAIKKTEQYEKMLFIFALFALLPAWHGRKILKLFGYRKGY